MTLRIGFIADAHLAEIANRTNIRSLWDRKIWENLDAVSGEVAKTIYKPASHEIRPLNAAVEFVRSVAHQLDLLVLLGDLSTTGLAEDINVAKDIFTSKSGKRHITSSIQPRFGVLGVPLHIIPGNHDRYQDDLATPGGEEFDRAFAAEYQPINSVCHQTLKSREVTLGLFSADFCYLAGQRGPKLHSRWGQGRASAVVLGELDRQTSLWKKRNPNKPVIWAIHFSPRDRVPDEILLENGSEVMALAHKLGVNNVFCGHTHSRSHDVGTHPHVYTAGSVSAFESRHNHFLHVARVSREEKHYRMQVRDYGYDEDLDKFVPRPPSEIA